MSRIYEIGNMYVDLDWLLMVVKPEFNAINPYVIEAQLVFMNKPEPVKLVVTDNQILDKLSSFYYREFYTSTFAKEKIFDNNKCYENRFNLVSYVDFCDEIKKLIEEWKKI